MPLTKQGRSFDRCAAAADRLGSINPPVVRERTDFRGGARAANDLGFPDARAAENRPDASDQRSDKDSDNLIEAIRCPIERYEIAAPAQFSDRCSAGKPD
jgi:hypothetical protein